MIRTDHQSSTGRDMDEGK